MLDHWETIQDVLGLGWDIRHSLDIHSDSYLYTCLLLLTSQQMG